MSNCQYKNLKGLKKKNLRDNMTTLELVLNMLAEATTTEIFQAEGTGNPFENTTWPVPVARWLATHGKAIETQTGVPVITSKERRAAQRSGYKSAGRCGK